MLPHLATVWPSALEQLEWTSGWAATAFGVRVGVRVDDPALLPGLRRCLPPGSRDSSNPEVDHLYSIRGGGTDPTGRIRRFYVGYAGLTRFVRTLDEVEALAAFDAQMNLDIATTSERWLFVHAGVVGWQGRAIVMPARSMQGKSRLVDVLVRAGATYYSDDIAVFDLEGRVHAHPRPLKLRIESGGARVVDVAASGAAIGSAPLPVGLVVATRYESAATRWDPRPLSPAESVLALLSQTVRARIAPGPTLQVLARAVEGAAGVEGPRGEASAVAADLLKRVAG